MKDYYVAYFDGATEPINPGGNMGVGAFILDKERKRIFEFSEYFSAKSMDYKTSNNVAEYMGILSIFEYLISHKLQSEKIIVCGDSKLVIMQMRKEWQCKGGIYSEYYFRALELRNKFENITFEWIPREKNEVCDILSKTPMIKNKCEFRIQKQ